MGCTGSKDAARAVKAPQAPVLATATMVDAVPADAVPAHRASIPQKCAPKASQFQIMLSGKWADYEKEEDMVLKRAYLIGQPNCRYHLRGQNYEYSFAKMVQRNLGSKKDRDIRPPRGCKQPSEPLLPKGPVVILRVPKGAAGTTIEIKDPNNPGKTIKVNVPKAAKAGQKMAVPIPEPGQAIEAVVEKQKKHSSLCSKVAKGGLVVALLGGQAVGGALLVDHLFDGAASDAAGFDIGEAVEAAGRDAVEAGRDAVEAARPIAEDAVEAAAPVVEDAGEWAKGAAETAAEEAEPAVDWLGDAAEDCGDFIMNLF